MATRYIAVASAKGGVGKSTVAIGLSHAFAEMGRKVLICDTDFGNACLDVMYGIENDVIYTVSDVALNRCVPFAAVVKTGNDNIFVLPCFSGGKGEIPNNDGILSALRGAAEQVCADTVIIDTGAGSSPVTDAIFSFADVSLIVCSHSAASVRAADATAERVRRSGREPLLIINSFDCDNLLDRSERNRNSLFEIIDAAGISPAGVVPYDYSIEIAGENPAKHYSKNSVRAFSNIAKRISGENIPLFSGIRDIRKKKRILFS